MAKFNLELPDEIIKDIKRIHDNSESIFGAMTRAGAEVVEQNIISSVPAGIRNSDMMNCLKITRTYKTPSDGGINTKVGFYGYFKNKNGVLTPAPLVANMFEYGTSKKKYPKKPFLRKAFRKGEIEAAMMAAQIKESGGLLDE